MSADAKELFCRCGKADFEAHCSFGPRIGNPRAWCVDVRARCRNCGVNYRFEGLPAGDLSGERPATPGYMGYSVTLPVVPLTRRESEIVDKADPFPTPPLEAVPSSPAETQR